MAQNIEMKTFNVVESDNHDSNIDEYEEVFVENSIHHTESPTIQNKLSGEYDFFTNHDVLNATAADKKKVKKKTRKRKKENLMDIIKHELALADTEMEENVIYDADFFKDSNFNVVVDRNKTYHRHWDAEVRNNNQCPNLTPQFPQIFENISTEHSLTIQYMPAKKFNDLINSHDEIQGDGVKFLTIEINQVQFKYFYSISLEELLVEKLLEMYKVYIDVQNNIKGILRDIKISRNIKENFKEELLKISSDNEEVKFDPNLRKYIQNVFLLKDKYNDLVKEEKSMLHKITSLCSDIEMVRQKSKRRKSCLDFEIKKIILDNEVYEEEWNKVFDLELSDLLDKIEYEYVTEYIEYKKLKYEEGCTKRKSKPKLQIDEDAIREEVFGLVQNLVNKEKYEFNVIENKITKIKKKGRGAVEKLIVLKMYVDDVFVCQTEAYAMQLDAINIRDSVSIQIMPNNEVLTIGIYENDVMISAHNIKIIDISKNILNADNSRIKFKLDCEMECTNKEIGSSNTIKDIARVNGVRLKSSNMFKGVIATTCEADIKIGWNNGTNTKAEDLKVYIDIRRKVNNLLANKGNNNTLMEVIERVYEQDISENESLIAALKHLKVINTVSEDKFDLDDNLDISRLKLLQLRNIGEFSDIESLLVPINSCQISTEQLNLLQKLNNNEFGQYLNKDRIGEMHPIEIQRHIGAKYMNNLNSTILKNLNNNLMKKSYKDVVCDFYDLSFRSILKRDIKLDNIFPNGLNHQWSNGHKKEIDIYIKILRAVNLPDRSAPVIAEEIGDEDDEDHIAGFKMRPLRPFVRVSCQDDSVQSVTAIGCHPTWNQTLRLKTKAGSASTVEINIFDEVKVNINDNIETDASLSKIVHYKCCNKWLGSVSIPLNALFSVGKLQGTIKVNISPFLLGYECPTKSEMNLMAINRLMKKGVSLLSFQITSSLSHLVGLSHSLPIAGDDFIVKHINNFISAFEIEFPTRKLSLTLIDSGGNNKCVTQFLQPILPPNWECFPKCIKTRGESAVSKSSSSLESKKNDDTPRSFEKESSYCGYEGRRDEMGKLIFGYLRYVSLIPAYEVQGCGVTLAGLELLNTLQGSHIDHTLLLASYFLYLGIKTWVVVGLGLPRGLSSYVLVKYHIEHNKILLTNEFIYEKSKSRLLSRNDEFSWYIFDGTAGEQYDLRDVTCPLKSVFYVFDEENIWVNIQQSQECESVTFDLNKSSNWRQVFDKNIFTMKMPPITDPKIYTNPVHVEELKHKLEFKIKTKIQKWRSHTKTIWNRYCSTLLAELLPQWECWRFNPMETKPGIGQRLRQLMVTYKVYGYPMNFPFTNMKTALAMIKSKCLHLNEEPTVEFGLAVELYSYPNSVISVWVALATVTRIE